MTRFHKYGFKVASFLARTLDLCPFNCIWCIQNNVNVWNWVGLVNPFASIFSWKTCCLGFWLPTPGITLQFTTGTDSWRLLSITLDVVRVRHRKTKPFVFVEDHWRKRLPGHHCDQCLKNSLHPVHGCQRFGDDHKTGVARACCFADVPCLSSTTLGCTSLSPWPWSAYPRAATISWRAAWGWEWRESSM